MAAEKITSFQQFHGSLGTRIGIQGPAKAMKEAGSREITVALISESMIVRE